MIVRLIVGYVLSALGFTLFICRMLRGNRSTLEDERQMNVRVINGTRRTDALV